MGNIKQYICCNCKAPLFFDPDSQKWKCHHCFSYFEKSEVEIFSSIISNQEHNTFITSCIDLGVFENNVQNIEEEPSLDSYQCSNCGAEIITDENTSATFCVYCKSPAIIKNKFTGIFKPRYILPFSLTKEKVEKLYSDWISSKKFAPSDFQSESEVKKITGLYIPYWLFSANINCSLSGGGTQVVTWSSGNYRYTETSHYNFERKGSVTYERIPVDGLIRIDNNKVECIEPFEYDDLEDFSMSYMAGFLVEKYDVPSESAQEVAKKRIKKYTDKLLANTLTQYNRTHSTKGSLDILNISNDYALMPIFILVNKYKGHNYEFLVNGQTGKISGITPIVPKKVVKFFFKTYFISLSVAFILSIILTVGGVFFV